MAIYVKNKEGVMESLKIVGLKGDTGETPDIQVGEVTTLNPGESATVTKRGTKEEPIFDFGIPKGDKSIYVGDVSAAPENANIIFDNSDEGVILEGIAPNIQIGNVTTVENDQPATVSRRGTNMNPIFDFEIPKGADGVGKSSNTSIDDATISANKTWSSSKIEDYVLTNDNTVWLNSVIENQKVESTKAGYLREVEILGNTSQNEEDLSNIKHLGELYVNEEGEPILDISGRKQYKIEINTLTTNLGEYELEPGALNYNTGQLVEDNTKFRTKDFIKLTPWLLNAYQNITDKYGYSSYYTYIFYDKDKKYIAWRNITQLKTSEIPKNAEYFKFYTLYGNLNTSNFKSKVWYSSSQNDSYCEYESNKTTVLLPQQLMKMGEVADRLYWDKNKGRYVIEKKIAVKIFNGTENWLKWGANTSDLKSFHVKWTDIEAGDWLFKGISNIFSPITGFNALYGDNGEGIAGHTGNWLAICISTEKAQDLNSFKEWLSENNLEAYHPYITPQLIETDLTEQLKLPTYINTTHISVNGGTNGNINAKTPISNNKVINDLMQSNYVLQQENEELKVVNKEQDELIDTTMLATDVMYTLLEPLLVNTLSSVSTSKMVDMYVAMVKRGLKKEEDIPAKYIEQAKEILRKEHEE